MEQEENKPQKSEGYVMKRKIKDSVFTRLFREKEYLFQLYQALHPEDTTSTIEDLKTITLENVFINDIINDLGFAVKDRLFVLVEAQSTVSVNIIIRSFMYLARTYQEYFDETKRDLYGTKPVKMPKPELYVVYTGEVKVKKEVITLSEEFFGGEETAIEVRIKVITEKNGRGIISQYITFSNVVNAQAKIYGRTSKAVTETIRICKNENVLKDFLKEHETEVFDIMTELFNQEKMYKIHIYNIIEESEARGEARGIAKGEARGEARGIAKGEARGIAKGEARGIAKGEAAATSSLIIRYMKKHNVSGSEAMDALDIPESERDMYYSMISE